MYEIPNNTLFVGKKIIAVPECSSTNTLALELDRNFDQPEGTVIITSHQTGGRGQRGRAWIADPGKNLTFSVLLRPAFLMIKNQFLLNVAISLAVCRAVRQLCHRQAMIKWPNDVLMEGKKIAGILIENQLSDLQCIRSVVGIGLNVNQDMFRGVEASSLRMISGYPFNLDEVLQGVLEQVEKHYMRLQQGRNKRLKEEYISMLFGMGKRHLFDVHHGRVEGLLLGVDASGMLILELDDGIKTFSHNEIRFVTPYGIQHIS